ncbi:hypothetical protein B0J13DRAFT_233069 [Dactylonectria estremocensis]|uniref:Uncharacterized protein n=1 Tax=Dactylonectria estremocensis TaxID=1079267 RepID=A0A9P9F9D0_9HYPO|nr:hypothetical protein B0J13DRAFT_233069 [Dactylonectria estremocensis]
MRTLTPSAINININNSSSTSSFDTPSSRSPVPALTSHPGHATTPSARSLSASAVNLTHNGKRLPASKSPKSPVTPAPQGRPRYPSAPIVNPDSRTPPLGFHEHKQQQHVLALTTTTRSKSSSASNMPPGDSRHRPPQLSAAAAKNIGRTPLTPKIAAKGPTIAALGRRAAQNREDGINSLNPRSSGRQSRGDSTITTPNGTPNLEKSHEGWDPRAILSIDSMRTASPGDSGDSKFFYASEARPVQPPSRPSTAAPKSSNFFYASEATTEAKRATSPSIKQAFAPMVATPPEPAASKFFYASGAPELSSKTSLQSSGPPSSGSSSSRPTGRPSTSSSATGQGHSMLQRPMSPIKMLQHHPIPPTIKNTTTPGLNSRPQLTSPPPLAPPSSSANAKRRISVDSAPRSRGHSRTVSVPSIDSGYSPRIPASPQQPSEPASPPASPLVVQPAMTMASILQAVEDFTEENEEEEEDTSETQPEIQSPTKSTQSADPVTEVVANARRERKVQDLEIRNGSLEAINRTLERQLRKQTAEIRRFKRMSRMSLASAATSRVTSETHPDIPISLADLSEEEDSIMSEEEEEEEEPDSLDDSDLESADSTSNPLESNEKLTVRRNRDERRLRLDLSKHRELLVDSQKINQSLKRCLNWTEVLIKEGQKALEYSVRVSDIELGGHVLAPADEDAASHLGGDFSVGQKALGYSAALSDVDCGGHMLAPPDEDNASHLDEDFLQGLEAGLEPPPLWEKSSQDRDSGIELHAEGI